MMYIIGYPLMFVLQYSFLDRDIGIDWNDSLSLLQSV